MADQFNILDASSGLPPRTLDPRQVTSEVAPAANQGYYLRVQGSGTISKLTIKIGVQSGNVCVAVYRNTGVGRNGRPSTRVATSGSVACPAVGAADVSLGATVTVQEGDWFYIGADNATVTFSRAGTNGAAGSFGDGMSHFEVAAFPAPATATPVAGSSFHSFIILGTP